MSMCSTRSQVLAAAAMSVLMLGLAAADSRGQCPLVETAQVGGSHTHVVYLNSTTILASRSKFLEKLDLTNPALPTVLASVDMGEPINDLAMSGQYLYVAYGKFIGTFDASLTPPSPLTIVEIPEPYAPIEALDRSGPLLVARGSQLHVYDVSFQPLPQFMSTINAPADSMAVSGNLLYTFYGTFGLPGTVTLRVFDLTDRVHPVARGSVTTTGNTAFSDTMTVLGTRAYCGHGTQLLTYNVADPSAPALSTVVNSSGEITSLGVVGASLWATTWGYETPTASGVRTYSLANPAAPTIQAFLDLPGPAKDLALGNGRAHIACQEAGLRVVSTANPAAPTLIGSRVLAAGSGKDITVSGSNSFIASEQMGVWIMNLTNPASPVLLAQAPTSDARSVTISGSRMLVADGFSGMRLFDITTPSSPVMRSTFNPPGLLETEKIGVIGNTAIMCRLQGNGQANIVDISNPALPVLRSTIDNGDYFFDVSVSGNIAYFANSYRGLTIYDLTNPAAPLARYVGPREGQQARCITRSGNLVYVGFGGGIRILDVGFPSSPFFVGSVTGGPATSSTSLTVSGNLLYAAGSDGIAVIDVSQPQAPVVVGLFDGLQGSNGVALQGSTVLDAEGTSGVRTFPAPTSWAPAFRFSPQDVRTCKGAELNLFANASAVPSASLQWRRQETALVDGPQADGSVISGATTGHLRIENLQPHGAFYTCLATNSCGSTSSDSARITVCAADFNCDGQTNPDDLGDFITCYFSQSACPGADYNQDGNLNPDDLGDFITAYFGQPC